MVWFILHKLLIRAILLPFSYLALSSASRDDARVAIYNQEGVRITTRARKSLLLFT